MSTGDIDGGPILDAMDAIEVADVASVASYGAAASLVLSGIAFALFLRGGVESVWGPVNDVLTAIAALLIIAPMLALLNPVSEDARGWFAVVTWLGIGGAVVMAVGQLLLVARLLSLQGSFVTGGIGVVPFLVWMLAHAVLAIGGGLAIAPIVGWLAIAFLVLAGLLALTFRSSPPLGWASGIGLLVVGAAWLVLLGVELGLR